jgi:DNA-binding NtrC family response regulator
VLVTTLMERRADIPLLLRQVALGIARESPEVARGYVREMNGRAELAIDADVVCALVERTYATHTRELSLILGECMMRARGENISLADLNAALHALRLGGPSPESGATNAPNVAPPPNAANAANAASVASAMDGARGKKADDLTGDELLAILREHNGVRKAVAETLRITVDQLRHLIDKRGIRDRMPDGRKGK